MFTPPSSPRKPVTFTGHVERGEDEMFDGPLDPQAAKRSIGRRLKWTAILVPITLIFITLSLRYITYPYALDILSANPPPISNWRDWGTHLSDRSPHIRHRRQVASSSSVSSPGSAASSVASPTSTSAESFPTIPSTPPILPTPFPRPFDASFTQNFSSNDCYSFFLNMSSSENFLECRPFSLLLQSSQDFVEQVQTNITLLNDVIWGTCNTKISTTQCVANMVGFATTLQNSCKTDLSAQNALVVDTLQALNAFQLMYTIGCLPDLSTNTYCYARAIYNPNPSDVYFFDLPLGDKLPNTTTPTCSACTKTMMGLYAQALGNETKGTLTGLEETYGSAASFANAKCGSEYAPTHVANTSGARRLASGMVLTLLSVIGLTILI